ncbi:MAG: rod shape-determining protein MreC [Thermoleophilia bacterium]|nr:rod shape-determining protein MreC [Thermoleophilia bacterium]
MTRRAVLAALLVLALALVSLSYRGGSSSSLNSVQLVVLDAVSPIERGLSRAWDPIAGAWNWGGRLIHAAEENPKLKRENEQLRLQVRISENEVAEAARLRALMNFSERGRFPNGFDQVFAHVQVRTPGAAERSLVIDRGSGDGIAVNDAVLATGGLIGRVTEVTSDTAVVGLILDDAQRVTASVTGSTATGVLQTVSTEGTPVLTLRYVNQSAEFDRYSPVVTSGFASKDGELRSVYPAGIPIGFVSNVGNNPADVHKTVQVTPFADFERIDEVIVLAASTGNGE